MKQKMYNKPFRPKRILIFLFFAATSLLALGGIVMLLWNAILPALLQVNVIGYWQAVGLLALCKILLTSFRPGPGNRRPSFGGPPTHIREKFMNMSEEEKVAFKERLQSRCGRQSKE